MEENKIKELIEDQVRAVDYYTSKMIDFEFVERLNNHKDSLLQLLVIGPPYPDEEVLQSLHDELLSMISEQNEDELYDGIEWQLQQDNFYRKNNVNFN